MAYLPLRGSDLTGSEGIDRTYTVSITGLIVSSLDIRLDNNTLIPDVDYEFDSNSNLLTIHSYVSDAQYITIFYSTIYSAAASEAYTTAAIVQSELRLTAAFSSSTYPSLDDVNRYIQEACKEIDIISNQTYSPVTVTQELHDFSGLQNIFQFPVTGLVSVDTVEYNVNGSGVTPSYVTLTEGYDKDYITYLANNEIQFIGGANGTLKGMPKFGLKRFRMTYTKGQSTIPYEIEHLATLMVAKRVISTLLNYQANTKQGTISVGPIRVADPSTFSPNYITQMQKDIIQLRHDIGLDTKIYKSSRVYDTNIPGYMNGGYYGGGFYG